MKFLTKYIPIISLDKYLNFFFMWIDFVIFCFHCFMLLDWCTFCFVWSQVLQSTREIFQKPLLHNTCVLLAISFTLSFGLVNSFELFLSYFCLSDQFISHFTAISNSKMQSYFWGSYYVINLLTLFFYLQFLFVCNLNTHKFTS